MRSLAPPPAGGTLVDRLVCLCLETVLYIVISSSPKICIVFFVSVYLKKSSYAEYKIVNI